MKTLLTVLPQASGWDLENFLRNARNYAESAGGLFLALMGTIGVIWGGTLLVKKLMAGQNDQTSWMKIILLILIGGALMVSGFVLLANIASGGRDTIESIGGASILFGTLPL